MQIKTTADFRKALEMRSDQSEQFSASRALSMPVNVGHETPDDEIERATHSIVRQGKIETLNFTFRFDSQDPKDVKEAADYVGSMAETLKARAVAITPAEPEPSINFTRTAAGASIGVFGGYSVALVLQELGKAGGATGNPFLSTFAAACTVGGAAIGAGLGSGMIQGEVSAFGVTLKTPGGSGKDA